MHSNKPGYNLVTLDDLKNQLNAQGTSPGTDKKLQKITSKVGVDEIILNQTPAKKVVERYGWGYDFYDINGYSLEMKYFLQDFSCFFLQNDPDMKIYAVRLWQNCKAFKIHNNDITSGSEQAMSLHDVFNYYRDEVQPRNTYDGTRYVDFGFYQYHFFPDDAPEEYIPIESITIKR